MKHLEVRQKYSAARRIFNSLLSVSSGDETVRLMLDILLKILRKTSTKSCKPIFLSILNSLYTYSKNILHVLKSDYL